MNELALFAGAGGGILGGELLGWRTVCAVEIDRYAASVLLARQNDGILPPFPVWDDICTFNGLDWRGIVDVVSGGFPCQDISCAGKGVGIEGKRSGLWKEMARIVGEVRPRFVFIENSPMLRTRGLSTVLKDLAEMGYDAEWGVLGADDVGAPHKRKRIWIVAYTYRHGHDNRSTEREWCDCIHRQNRKTTPENAGWEKIGVNGTVQVSEDVAHSSRIFEGRSEQWTERERIGQSGESSNVSDPTSGGQPIVRGAQGETGYTDELHKNISDTDRSRCKEQWGPVSNGEKHETPKRGSWWLSEPDVGRVAHGVAARVDRLKAIGNGQVPAVAALAWKILTDRIDT